MGYGYTKPFEYPCEIGLSPVSLGDGVFELKGRRPSLTISLSQEDEKFPLPALRTEVFIGQFNV